MEAYSSLVALLPTSAIAAAGSTQTQDSVSPASTVSGGATTPMRSSGAMSRATVSPAGQKSAIHIVSDILLSQLERYVTTPKEDLRYREARRKRAANIGSQLSQMEVMDEEESPDGFKGIPGDKSMPFRFEMCISTRSSNRVDNKSKGGKSKKSLPIGQTLLAEATSRINEPLDFLIASSLSVTTIDNQGELKKALDQIRLRMAGCSDIEEYLKWIKGRKEVFEITDNAKRAEEMEIGKLATLVLVAAVAEVLMGTCEWSEGNGIEVIGSSESTNEVVESLFNLRYDAISRAAEIMSSFVSSKSKKPARATKKLKNVDMNSQQSQPSTDKIKSSKASVVKSNEINPATLARNQKLVEDAIFGMCPAMPPGFLSTSLRKFGALVSTSYKVCSQVRFPEILIKNAQQCQHNLVAYMISIC